MIDVKQLDKNFTDQILEKLNILAAGAPRSIKKVEGTDGLHTVRSSDSNVGSDINGEDLPDIFDVELNDGAKVKYAAKGYHSFKSLIASLCSDDMKTYLLKDTKDIRGKEYTVYPELVLPVGVNDPELKALPEYQVYISFVEKITTSRLSQLCKNAIDLNERILNSNPDYVQKFDKKNFDTPEIDNLAIVDSSSGKIRKTLPSFDAPYLKTLTIQSSITDIGDIIMHSIEYFNFKGSQAVHVGNVSFYNATNIDQLFKDATALEDVKSIDMRNVYSAEDVFTGCTSLKDGGVHLKNVPRELDLSNIGCDVSKYVVDNYIDDPVKEEVLVLTDDNHSIADRYNYDMRGLMEHIPEKLDTSKLTNFSGMFNGMRVLTKVPKMDMSKATNTSSMFSNTHITDFPEWLNMNKVTNAKGMFSGCGYLKPTKAINTESVIDMSGMFCGTSFDTIPEFSTKQAKNLSNLFNGNYRLVELPWAIDLSSAENVGNMFQNAKNTKDNGFHLKNVPRSLDLSKIGIAAGKYVIDNYID